jgi:S-adenosylmethionine uptake transporter
MKAITIAFIAPLLIPLFAQLILGERMRREVLLALLLGFGGVLVAVQGPPTGEAHPMRWWGVAAVLVSAVTYALGAILMRMRSLKDGPATVALLGNLWPVALLSLPVAVLRPVFHWSDLPWLALVGLLGAVGLYLLTRAYHAAEAQLLAVSEYTALGWAAMLGWIFFQEQLRWQTLAGGVLIVASSLWVTRLSRVREPMATASEAALP